MHGPRPQAWQAASRTEEFGLLAERVRSWLSAGLEPHAIGVTARSAALVREAREAFVACTRARDHLHVSGAGEPSPFLPPGAVEPVPPPAALHSR